MPQPGTDPVAAGPRWQPALVAVAVSVAAAVLYLLLAGDQFYKTDGTDIARLLDDRLQQVPNSQWPHPWHVGYLPALLAFRDLLEALGLRPNFVQLGAWFSALAAAIGIGFCHAAFLRLLGSPRAWWATLLLALSPTVTLFATVVEYHGPLLAPLGACLWWTARQIERASAFGMLVLALLHHLAFVMYGQALFFPLWTLALLLWRNRHRPSLRTAWLVAFSGACHLALWWLLPRLLSEHYGFWADLTRGFAAESSIGRPQSLDYLPEILWQEWFRPLLPLSLAPLVALCLRNRRREALLFWLGLAPFLLVSVRQLVWEPEFGAYLLPLLPGAAMLAAQLPCSRKWLVVLLLLTVANRATLHPFRQPAAVDQLAAEVHRVANGKVPFVLLGSHRELTVAYETFADRAEPRGPMERTFLWVRPQASAPRAQFRPEEALGIEQFLKLLLSQGRVVLITKTALASLDDPKGAMLAEKGSLRVEENEAMAGPLYAEYLRRVFRVVPTDSDQLFSLNPP